MCPAATAVAAPRTAGPASRARGGWGGRRRRLLQRRPPKPDGARDGARTATARAALKGLGGGAAAEPDGPLKVVVTGSSSGLGKALARAFVRRGDAVVVSSRDAEATAACAEELTALGPGTAFGRAADVTKAGDVDALAAFAEEALGGLDCWINNAGTNAYAYTPLVDADAQDIERVVLTNTLGTLLCSRAAMRVMRKQASGGHVFNMEGAGSDGSATKLYAAYGMTKAGMAQLSKSLNAEAQQLGLANVGVHTVSPGMVATEMIFSGRYAFGQQGRFFVNLLAEDADVVAETLVPRLRTVSATQGAKDEALKALTPDKVLTRLWRRLLLGENKDRWYPEADAAGDAEFGPPRRQRSTSFKTLRLPRRSAPHALRPRGSPSTPPGERP